MYEKNQRISDADATVKIILNERYDVKLMLCSTLIPTLLQWPQKRI